MPVSTFTITYSRPGTVPPVFVAGSFSSPPWEPQRLDYGSGDESGSFTRTFSASPGTYQYKFRLGTGDWWVIDEAQKTATDDQGNINNILTVQDSKTVSKSPQVASAKEDLLVHSNPGKIASADIFTNTANPEPPPTAPVSVINVQVQDERPPLSSQVPPPAFVEATAVRNVSHELPTPPISEGGGDTENKEAPAELTDDGLHDLADSVRASKSSEKQVSSSVPLHEWNRTRNVLLLSAVAIIPVLAWSLSR